MSPRKTVKRFQIIVAFYVTGRRFRIRSIQARAERAAKRLKIGKALLCTCTLNPFGKALFERLAKSAGADRALFRTKQ